jgi:uncharacterized protein (TIGR04255 family)
MAIAAFWFVLGSDQGRLPKGSDTAPIVQLPEQGLASQLFQSFPEVPQRCWFFNRDETRLIQVQDNLFLHNWRKVAPAEEYLHYDDLRPHFERAWQEFRAFSEQEALGALKVSLCEVTYVNHIDRGSGWETFAELSDVFPNWSPKTSANVLPSPEHVAINASYLLNNADGRIYISVQPAIRQSDAKETIQLTVTVRCKPSSSSDKDIYRGLDEARSWVVLGFTDFTGPKMHEIWGRKS